MRDGARKWKGPRRGLNLLPFLRYAWYLTVLNYAKLGARFLRTIISLYACIYTRGVCVGGGHTLVPEKLARDVQILTSHDHDLLAVEKLLGHDTGQTTKEMSLAIDNDLRNPDPLAQLFPQISTGQLEALQKTV